MTNTTSVHLRFLTALFDWCISCSMKQFYKETNTTMRADNYIFKFNPFSTNIPFLYPWKHLRTRGFLMFSDGIEVEHWLNMGKKYCVSLISAKGFIYIPPENIRNPEVSWHFQEVWKLARFTGLKRDKCARTQQ